MPDFFAARAAVIASRPLVDAPSESSTIADGAAFFAPDEPPGAVTFSRLDTELAIASPLAVPPLAFICAMASRAASRSVEGDASTAGVWLNAMTPTLTFDGTLSRNVRAARLA